MAISFDPRKIRPSFRQPSDPRSKMCAQGPHDFMSPPYDGFAKSRTRLEAERALNRRSRIGQRRARHSLSLKTLGQDGPLVAKEIESTGQTLRTRYVDGSRQLRREMSFGQGYRTSDGRMQELSKAAASMVPDSAGKHCSRGRKNEGEESKRTGCTLAAGLRPGGVSSAGDDAITPLSLRLVESFVGLADGLLGEYRLVS